MYALPPGFESADEPQVTGLGCPACHGVLNVQREGRRGALVFTCRIGHTFSTYELLRALEQERESHLWNSITAYEELIAVLGQLESRAAPEVRRHITERLEGARERVAGLRQLLQKDSPLDLDGDPLLRSGSEHDESSRR